MATIDNSIKYMNILASAIKIVDSFHGEYTDVYAIHNRDKMEESVCKQMDQLFEKSEDEFLAEIECLLHSIEVETSKDKRFTKSFAFCQWMDSKIVYDRGIGQTKEVFSLYHLIPLHGSSIIEMGALNNNYKETGIWLNPKFDIASPYFVDNGEMRERPLANRDIFEGFNSVLQHCCYIRWNYQKNVCNIILPQGFLRNSEQDYLTMAFAPLTDRKDIIKTEACIINRNGMDKDGVIVLPLKEEDANIIVDRFKKDWELANEVGAQLMFAPELLGSSKSESGDGYYNDMIMEVSQKMDYTSSRIPDVTMLPSYWHKNRNWVTLVDRDGGIIGRQKKHIPFVNIRKGFMEALDEMDEWTTILVHIPGMHRIAVMICAEFLAMEQQLYGETVVVLLKERKKQLVVVVLQGCLRLKFLETNANAAIPVIK